MKFNYNFANLLGSVYHRGDLVFDSSSNTLYSPIGNRLSVYDIKNGQSRALPLQVDFNIEHVALSPNGRLLITSTEKCHIHISSPQTGHILYRKDFGKSATSINGIKFSPNGNYYAILVDNKALVYFTPGIALTGRGRELSPFKIHKVLKAHYDQTTCVSWSTDSRLLAVGSKDLTVKIFSSRLKDEDLPSLINLSGHSDIIVRVFFADFPEKSNSLITISRNGQLFLWTSCLMSSKKKNSEETDNESKVLSYTRAGKHYFRDSLKNDASHVYVSQADYNPKIHLLVTGFTNGSILLHELPDFSLIYSLELNTLGSIDGITISPDTDWIAIGSGVRPLTQGDVDGEKLTQSQLVVWEWRTENFVFKQTGCGAGYTHITECVSFSPDGLLLASGGSDAKVRLWDTASGFCFATFSKEHKGPITALQFQQGSSGKVLISASLDGTVRAFDLNRYRNFRTLASVSEAKPAQFISLAVDPIGGDFVAAGAQNCFEIFLWTLKAGRLLETLTGHEGPVSGLAFSPKENILISCSWDKTIRTWNLFEGNKCTREVIQLDSDLLGLAIRPEGNQIAASTVNGNIYFFEPESATMLGAPIEGTRDLSVSVSGQEISRNKEKFFSCLSYSSDGQYIICGGHSKHLCIYHIGEKILVKRFTFTCNRSYEGLFDYISKRKKAEFGFNEDLIKQRDENDFAEISLPGVRRGDLGDRSVNPLVVTYSVQFSPTMRSFVAATTEGVLVFSLDNVDHFDPFELDDNVNPTFVKESLENGEFLDALIKCLKLKDLQLFSMVVERTPLTTIPLIVQEIPFKYVEHTLSSLASCLEKTQHVHFYLIWCHYILRNHSIKLKSNYSHTSSMSAVLRLLRRHISKYSETLLNLVDFNHYRIAFIEKNEKFIPPEEEIREELMS